MAPENNHIEEGGKISVTCTATDVSVLAGKCNKTLSPVFMTFYGYSHLFPKCDKNLNSVGF